MNLNLIKIINITNIINQFSFSNMGYPLLVPIINLQRNHYPDDNKQNFAYGIFKIPPSFSL